MNELPDLQILLVEDNPINQQVAMGILVNGGHEIDLAENGLEALEKFETGHYDLILMDVQMPKMSGLEATKKIRERERDTGGHIPIIGLTAQVLEGDREACIQAGMDDYVPKPIKKDLLFDALSRIGNSSNNEEIENETVTQDVRPVLDIDALDLLRGLESPGVFSLGDLIGTYIDTTSDYFHHIENAIQMGDTDVVSSNAHALKGSCQSVGAVRLSNISEQLELLGKEGHLEGALDILAQMSTEFEIAKEALQAYVNQGKTN